MKHNLNSNNDSTPMDETKDKHTPINSEENSIALAGIEPKQISKNDDSELTPGELRKKKFVDLLDRISFYISGTSDAKEEAEVNDAVRAPVIFGGIVVLVFLGFGFLWSVLAPIDSAAIAQGSVVLDLNKRTVQHLEGGIISEIMIKEGDHIKEGQTLIRLDSTNALARQGIITVQIAASTALEARLIALRDDKEEISFPEWLITGSEHSLEIKELIESEKQIFVTKKKALAGHIDILNQKIAQYEDQINGLEAQEKATSQQVANYTKRVKSTKILLEKGSSTQERLLTLESELARIQGQLGEYTANIAQAQQAIIETNLEIISVKNNTLSETVSQLRDAQNTLADLNEKRQAVDDVVERLEIKAKSSGIVTNLKYFTVGGVISPATPILEIIPQDDQLLIEAFIKPQDIDVVRQGLEARVRLTAFKVRKIPMINGEVVHVSPDSFRDEATGAVFYKARILLDSQTMSKLNETIELYPGMPADVLIVTGERTFMSYLMSPITDTFSKAFREE